MSDHCLCMMDWELLIGIGVLLFVLPILFLHTVSALVEFRVDGLTTLCVLATALGASV